MHADPPEPPGLGASALPDLDWATWDAAGENEPYALVDLVNRVLDKGVVITGDVTLSVAGVDLVYLGLNAVLTSVSTARRSLGRDVGRPGEGAR